MEWRHMDPTIRSWPSGVHSAECAPNALCGLMAKGMSGAGSVYLNHLVGGHTPGVAPIAIAFSPETAGVFLSWECL